MAKLGVVSVFHDHLQPFHYEHAKIAFRSRSYAYRCKLAAIGSHFYWARGAWLTHISPVNTVRITVFTVRVGRFGLSAARVAAATTPVAAPPGSSVTSVTPTRRV